MSPNNPVEDVPNGTRPTCSGNAEEQMLLMSRNRSESVESFHSGLQSLTSDEEATPLIGSNNPEAPTPVQLARSSDINELLAELRSDLETKSADLQRQISSLNSADENHEEQLEWLRSEVNRERSEDHWPDDTYSFLAITRANESSANIASSNSSSANTPLRRPSCSFLVAVFVFVFQAFTFSLLAVDVIDIEEENNPLGIPAGVDWQVRASQVVALFITVITQDEVRQSLNVLYYGYDEEALRTVFGGASKTRWRLSVICRFLAGALGLFVTFMLVITQESVRELLLNFTAVEFVSNVDDTIFLLSKWGYFGEPMKEDARGVGRLILMGENESAHLPAEAVTAEAGAVETGTAEAGTVDVEVERAPERPMNATKKFPRTLCLCVILAALIVGWVIVVIFQETGKYLSCKSIYIQFGDEFSIPLGTFSGLYVVDENARGRGRVKYVLIEAGDGTGTAKFSYCRRQRRWTFTYGNDRNESPDACDGDKIRAKSSESFTFDLYDTALDTWFVQAKETGEEVPIQHLSMSCRSGFNGQKCNHDDDCGDRLKCDGEKCICEAGWYGSDCQFPMPCERLEVNTRFKGFTDARPWSSRYSTFMDENVSSTAARVYGRPLYIGDVPQKVVGGPIQRDLMFFTGRRWALTHTGKFKNVLWSTRNLSSIAEYMTGEFHAHWSDYSVTFLSEPVDDDTPLDGVTPVSLKWFHAKTERSDNQIGSIFQSPDPNRLNEARLLCAICNNNSNPCLFNNTCQHDGSCVCRTGSKGTLCQITPGGDGLCNPYYNNPEYGYDGGDCCPATCSMDSMYHFCGMRDVESLGIKYRKYVGYPSCKDPEQRCSAPCWKPRYQYLGSGGGARAGSSVALSGNGGVFSVYEPGAGQLHVFEQNGLEWVRRGLPLKRKGPAVTLPAISRSDLSPIMALSEGGGILAVGWPADQNYTGSVQVFHWMASFRVWRQLGSDIPNRWSVALSSDGSILATGNTSRIGGNFSHYVTVFKYEPGKDWSRLGTDIGIEDKNGASSEQACSLSLSSDGRILAAGLAIYTFSPSADWTPLEASFEPQLAATSCSVAMSGDGTVVAFSSKNKLILTVYKYSNATMTWSKMGSDITEWIITDGASASLSRNGTSLAVGVPYFNRVRVYKHNKSNETWEQFGTDLNQAPNDHSGSSVSLSSDGTTLAYGAPAFDRDFYGVVNVVWNTWSDDFILRPRPGGDLVNITIEMQLDDAPDDTGFDLECNGTSIERYAWGEFSLARDSQKGEGRVEVPRGERCKLTVTDIVGDGMCCRPPRRGFFNVYYGESSSNEGALLIRGGRMFGSRELLAFFASPPESLIDITIAVELHPNNLLHLATIGGSLICGDILQVEAPPGVFRQSDPLRTATFLLPEDTECNLNIVTRDYTPSPRGYGNFMIFFGSDYLDKDKSLLYRGIIRHESRVVSFIARPGCDGCQCVRNVPVFPSIDCPSGFSLLRFELNTDFQATDITLQLNDDREDSTENSIDRIIVDSCSTFVNQTCLPNDSCFVYRVVNLTTNDETPCCEDGEATYSMYFDDVLIDQGGNFPEIAVVREGCDIEPTYEPSSSPTSFPQVDCDDGSTLFHLELTMDTFPQDIHWEVLDGSEDVILDGGPYRSADYVDKTIIEQTCIPGASNEACAIFVIHDLAGDGLCCEHGRGQYKVSLGSDTAIGGEFGSLHETRLGVCPDSSPTAVPLSTDEPTYSPVGCTDGQLVRFELQTDRKPEDILWAILPDSSDSVIMEGGPYRPFEDAFTTFDYVKCVPVDGCLVFFIEDASEDGICCENGMGSYRLFLDDSLISTGGDFGGRDTSPVGSCMASPYDSSDSSESLPSQQCEADSSLVRVELSIDLYPEETTWEIVDKTNEVHVLGGGPYTEQVEASSVFMRETCVSNEACLSFEIQDSYGDGICCESGQGYYKVYLGDELVVSGGDFGFVETVEFGNC